jgi:hypothetical protein
MDKVKLHYYRVVLNILEWLTGNGENRDRLGGRAESLYWKFAYRYVCQKEMLAYYAKEQ